MNSFLVSLLAAIVLLMLGFVLRARLKLLKWCYVPACIVGGCIGLLLVQVLKHYEWQVSPLVESWQSWPGLLIAVVFAGMLLGGQSRSASKRIRQASSEALVVWIIVLGQTAIGLLCTWLLIQPFFNVPNSFGMLIETGFAGGHGTAAAMGAVFDSPQIALAGGRDLGMFMATVGLLFSVLSGVVYVNLGVRRGWLSSTLASPDSKERELKPTVIAHGTVDSAIIDPLVFQILVLGLAFGLGYGMKAGVSQVASSIDAYYAPQATPVADLTANPATDAQSTDETDAAEQLLGAKLSVAELLGGFPLFIYTLLGGLLVRKVFEWFGQQQLIDPLSIQRLTGAAMEFLVIAAIASLKIEAVYEAVGPLLILLSAAFLWTAFCLLHVARVALPRTHWFELGILNYGMSTGTTATGFTLLKMVDPELKSGAAEDYALAAPASSPFVGGGLLTVMLPLLVLEFFPIAATSIVLTAIVLCLYFVARRLAKAY